MSTYDILDHVKTLMEGINTYIDVRYFGVFISKDIYNTDKDLVAIGHTAPFHNELWEKLKSEFNNTFKSFKIPMSIDYNDVCVETFDLNSSNLPAKTASDMSVVFQMPLMINDLIIGALVIIDQPARELTFDNLTLIGLLSDQFSVVCENRMLIENIQKISITDELTGLFNRRYTLIRLEEDFSRSKRYYVPLSIVMADVDHFKRLNDTFGHQAGDTVLQEISAVFRRNIRNTDIVGRYGGEEFLFILPHTSIEGTKSLIQRIQKDIKNINFKFNGQNVLVTLSFGVSTFPNGKKMVLDSFLESADQALYKAKNSGRNTMSVSTPNDLQTNEMEYLI